MLYLMYIIFRFMKWFKFSCIKNLIPIFENVIHFNFDLL